MNELAVVDPPEATVSPASSVHTIDASSAGSPGDNDFTVLQRGNRLQITADIDLAGIATLKEMLSDYESILRRLAGKKRSATNGCGLSNAAMDGEVLA